eukprot:11735561-Heterocapsa_arctica.AAC.1
MDIRELWLQDEIRNKTLRIDRINSADNTADVLTKALTSAKFAQHIDALGLKFVEELDDR